MDAITIEDLHYAWADGRSVFDGLDLTLSKGERVGLAGPNGAGKTTFFLLTAGMISPTKGLIRVLGEKPGSPSLRGKVGLVFQSAAEQLFCTTVAEDVAFGPRNLGVPADQVAGRVGEALAQVNAAGWEERVPHHLSGGEKRKVALATVLAMAPEVLLLDEPANDLDAGSRNELKQILKDIPSTQVIASHDFEFLLDTCDRVVVLSEGRMRLDDAPEVVFKNTAGLKAAGLAVSRGLKALLSMIEK